MWEFGQRYSSEGEFNPRLIACGNCTTYLEPEQFTNSDWCNECELYMSGEID